LAFDKIQEIVEPAATIEPLVVGHSDADQQRAVDAICNAY